TLFHFSLTSPPSQSPLFLFHATATTQIYTLSLHDALPILVPPSLKKPLILHRIAVDPEECSDVADAAVVLSRVGTCLFMASRDPVGTGAGEGMPLLPLAVPDGDDVVAAGAGVHADLSGLCEELKLESGRRRLGFAVSSGGDCFGGQLDPAGSVFGEGMSRGVLPHEEAAVEVDEPGYRFLHEGGGGKASVEEVALECGDGFGRADFEGDSGDLV